MSVIFGDDYPLTWKRHLLANVNADELRSRTRCRLWASCSWCSHCQRSSNCGQHCLRYIRWAFFIWQL